MNRKFKPGDRISIRNTLHDYTPDWRFGVYVKEAAGSLVWVRYDGEKAAVAEYKHKIFREFEGCK